jgi:hypothetical protein
MIIWGCYVSTEQVKAILIPKAEELGHSGQAAAKRKQLCEDRKPGPLV